MSRVGERKNAYRVSVGRPDGRRTLERPRIRWEDNIKMDFQDVGWGCMDWTDVAVVGTGSGRLRMLIRYFTQSLHINIESIIRSFVHTH